MENQLDIKDKKERKASRFERKQSQWNEVSETWICQAFGLIDWQIPVILIKPQG